MTLAESNPSSTPQDLAHAARRMLQALDGYWAHCEGGNGQRHHNYRDSLQEDWWTRFERYRREVEKCL